jgi:N,N'-diacetylchitobiose transport system permease protein
MSTVQPLDLAGRAGAAATPPRRRKFRGLPYGLLLPAVAIIILALGYPLVRQVWLSFHEFGLKQQFGQPAEWVGLQNYVDLATDPYLWEVLGRSVLFCLVNAGITLALGLFVALVMQAMSTGVRIATQAALLLAWAMPVLAVLTVWQWMFDTTYGVVNWGLTALGGDFSGHSWLIEPLSFFGIATLIIVWMSVPFVAFTIYAGLTQVSTDAIEAAMLDGAGTLARVRHIMLPAIKPVLAVVGLLQIVWDLRVFTQIYVLQRAGGTAADTNLLGTYVYRLGIGEGSFGMAAAVAMFLLDVTIVLTSPYLVTMFRQED